MSDENVTEENIEVDAVEIATDDYTTESEAPAAPAVERRAPVVIDHPIQTVGCRKEAVVRVRLVPGTGQFHQRWARPGDLTLKGAPAARQVAAGDRRPHRVVRHLRPPGRRRPSGQAGALRLAIARALIEVSPEDRPALKKAGFTRDPRRRAQEVRPEEGPQGIAVQQALNRVSRLFEPTASAAGPTTSSLPSSR